MTPHSRTLELSGLWLVVVLTTLSFNAIHAQVVINEVHYDPVDKTVPEEFIELYNAGAATVDLSGWHLTDAVFFSFPPGTQLDPDSYLVIAEDPATITSLHGLAGVLGPFVGRLSNDGDEIILRDDTAAEVDRVNYDTGFPWPLDTMGKGSSMELIHPDLDNDLGGSWRAAGASAAGPTRRVYLLEQEALGWKYRKGTSAPPATWREVDFDDGGWITARTSIGYGDGDDRTELTDMRNGYSSIYLRRLVSIDSPDEIPPSLRLGIYADDGCVVWINGQEVERHWVPDGDLAHDDFADNHESSWDEFSISPGLLRVGTNVIAVHALNTTIGSSDFSIDVTLYEPAAGEGTSGQPSPGAQNSVYAQNAPPQIRQVDHSPEQPRSVEDIVISAKVTDPDGVGSVSLHYQVVRPGQYIPSHLPLPHSTLLGSPSTPLAVNPDYTNPANWTTVDLFDDGFGPDVVAGDDVYSVTIPAQGHRHLLRYRITVSDSLGAAADVPYADDDSLNFAAFIYDGIPGYTVGTRTVHPAGVGYTYPPEVIASLPVYHLLTDNDHLTHCIAYSSGDRISKGNEGARDKFNWPGTFVYEGKVHDNIRYRLRQANDRYGGAGKRSMRFRFNRGNYLRARDNYGERFRRRWRTLNTGKMFDNKDVGNFGLTEAMNANLYNLVGVPAPWFYTFHLRVINGAQEAPSGTNGQYSGDFWGMYSGIENYDPIFIDGHRMPDGNLYKLKDGQFNGADLLRNQGRYSVKPDADFQNIRSNLRPERDDAWLDAHVNYEKWSRYHAVNEGIRHYDVQPADSHSKNRAWFFEPDYARSPYGRMYTLPHDSDASWGPNWGSGVDYAKNAIFANGGKPTFLIPYRNNIREFRNLIWTQEVINTMIDDLGEFVIDFSKADRDRWRSAPSNEGRQDFGTIENKIADMKRFAFTGWSGSSGPTVPAGGRAQHLTNLASAGGESSQIPLLPTISYSGEPNYPMDGVELTSGAFRDPQGNQTFGGLEWHIGEISPPGLPFNPTTPRVYEYSKPWRSGLILSGVPLPFHVPPTALRTGRRYRARVRHRDTTNRWSHWSNAVEFTVTPPSNPPGVVDALKITEVMYNPPGGSGFEFLELQNLGAETVDLSEVRLTEGIEFDFRQGAVTELEPGQIVLVVNDLNSFSLRYDTSNLLIAGEYDGNLSNGSEDIELTWGGNLDIIQFDYFDTWYDSTDGGGHSLQVFDPYAAPTRWSSEENWVPSSIPLGTPGFEDFPDSGSGLRKPGDANGDTFLDIGDALSLLLLIYRPGSLALPCEGETAADGGNLPLLDANGDGTVDSSDAVHFLTFLYLQGPAHELGTSCTRIEGCESLPCS